MISFENTIKRSIRFIRGNILRRIVASFITFAVVVSVVHVIDIHMNSTSLLSEYFASQQKQEVEVVLTNVNAEMKRINNFLVNLPKLEDKYMSALEENDAEALNQLMRFAHATFMFHGYVITDAEGQIIATNYEAYTDAQERAFARYTKHVIENQRENDNIPYEILDVLNQGPSFVKGIPVTNEEGEVIAVNVIVNRNVRQKNFLNYCSELTHLDCYTYENDVCVTTSLKDNDSKNRVIGQTLDSEIKKELLSTKKPVARTEEEDGNIWMSFYLPIFDYKHDFVAVFNSKLDMTISRNLSNAMSTDSAIMSIIIALIMVIFEYIFFKRTLIKPLKVMCKSLDVMSHGDLSHPVPDPQTNDEVQKLRDSMEITRREIARTIKTIKVTSEKLRLYSVEMNDSARQLSDGANQQAASLEEVSSSLEEMTANIHQTTHNAQTTQELVQKADETILNIAGEATVNRDDSLKISDALASINELVSQTNILSLNASVEAARAGEQGKGFAVVAKEVGRLADQTRDTAIGIDETASKVISGADKINTRIDEITPQIHEVANLVDEIATSSKEQDLGAEQINSAINSLNQVTQNTAAKAEEISANSQELSNTAIHLDTIVKKFKL